MAIDKTSDIYKKYHGGKKEPGKNKGKKIWKFEDGTRRLVDKEEFKRLSNEKKVFELSKLREARSKIISDGRDANGCFAKGNQMGKFNVGKGLIRDAILDRMCVDDIATEIVDLYNRAKDKKDYKLAASILINLKEMALGKSTQEQINVNVEAEEEVLPDHLKDLLESAKKN